MGTYKGFSHVKLRKPERSKFDLSHEKKLSAKMGDLVPIFFSETLPNDTFRVNSEVMLRLAPLLAPIYHRVNVFVHFFFVPMRLLLEEWEQIITNGRLGTETPPVVPQFRIDSICGLGDDLLDVGSLADYLGVPPIPDANGALWSNPLSTGPCRLHAAPFAAYYKVWYDYYRDRNFVEDNTFLPIPSGLNPPVNTDQVLYLKQRAWQHDYFTSALPWTQRGTEVLMPLEGTGTVTYTPWSTVYSSSGTVPYDSGNPLIAGDSGVPDNILYADGSAIQLRNIDEVEIDASSVSINDLRQAVRLQEWLERNAVAGSRYNESIMAHFARRTSDGRLQRAEYLGGGRVNVQISEVMTTSWSQDASSVDVPPANMTGRGAAYSKQNKFTYNCEEHGFVMGIMSVMPTTGYMQGLPRMFSRRNDFLDYPWPSFAHLGEQEVYDFEIFNKPETLRGAQFPEGQPVFGYQSRYADWKYIPSTAHGDFRTTLDFWHLDRKFFDVPTLNEGFVTYDYALADRIFAVADTHHLWCYIYNNVSVVRSLPYFGTPLL